MDMKESKFWPPLHAKFRYPGQWPFSDAVTTRVCRHAGREASAMLYVALHKNRADGKDINAALRAVYYEPFVYWDWHGIDAEDKGASKHKKQLVWERQRGFTAAESEEYGYKYPQAAWYQFRDLINKNAERRRWVKRIAVAHWMNVEDLTWIFQNLTSLEALDLSDIALFTVEPYKGYANEPPKTMSDTWSHFFLRMPSNSPARKTALRLKWLGLPDFRDDSLEAPRTILVDFLPSCKNLQILSIRGKYREEIPPPNLSGHEYVCEFIRGIKTYTPASVTALELRLSIPFLHELLVALHTEDRLNINQIRLDIGAWTQVYPLRITSEAISDNHVVSAASKAARKARFDIYEQQHNELLSTSSKWLLPAPAPEEDTPDTSDELASPGIPAFEKPDARPVFRYEPYNAKGGSDIREYSCHRGKLASRRKCLNKDKNHHKEMLGSLERTHVNSLPSMLVKLHDASRTAASQDYSIYSLKPEWQTNSTTPLHPFTMIQKYQPVPTLSMDQGRDYKEPTADRLKEAYAWLNTTFAWRPIFDWDYFVSSGRETVKGNLDIAFSSIHQQYKLGNPTKKNNEVLIGEVAKQFQIMRDAGIPIHLLLGCRNSDESSLYWGWPYDSDKWEQSLKAPLDAGLAPVVAHIDTLSIFYDLRNPLDEQRLEEIDEKQPYRRPDACCPRPEDPWRLTKNSPFKKQWQDRPSRICKRKTQKTANKKLLGGKSCVPLASNLTSCPPAGEYADENPCDDPETDRSIPETLHQIARHAAFEREAIMWQRFWTKYAPQMTNLKELRVRMPQNFDGVGSWSLCKLLTPRKNWIMFGYADERGHMQTEEDLLHHVADDYNLHIHAAQDKVWPAGRFVRRSWISWTPDHTDTAGVVLHGGTGEAESPTPHPPPSNKSTDQHKTSKPAEVKREKEQLAKAVKQARETARKEQELEASLPLPSLDCLVKNTPAIIPTSEDIEERLTGTYGRHIRGVAQKTWRAEMRGYIEQLEEGALARNETVYSLYKKSTEAQVDEATIKRNVLRDTRELLRKRMQDFRPEEVFAPCDPTERANGLELVKHTTDYAVEERKRRGEPEKEDVDQLEKPKSELPSTNTTADALPGGPQQPRATPIEISSEESSSESMSSDEDDPQPVKFAPAVSTKRITATQTVTAMQSAEVVHTSQIAQTAQTQQQDPTVRQPELAQQLANSMTTGQTPKIPKFGSKANKEPIEGDRAVHQTTVGFSFGFAQEAANEKAAKEKSRSDGQVAENKKLLGEKEAAVAKEAANTKAAEKAGVAAERKDSEEKQKSDELKKQNDEIKRQAAADKKRAKEIEAAAKKTAADEKAAKEEAELKAKEVKNKADAEKKELRRQVDEEKKKARDDVAATKKKAKDDIAAEKKRTAEKEAARKEAEQKAADEAAEATKIAAIKARAVAATIKTVNNESTPDIVETIEQPHPAKPTKKLTKSPKTPKGTKRKQPSPDPSDEDAVNEPKPVKKSRPSKGATTTSTPVRRSERLRTQTPAKTPTPQVKFPSDMSVTESSEDDTNFDNRQKKGKKVKKEPENVDEYKPPGSTKKRTPTKGTKTVLGKVIGGKATTPVKGKGKGRKKVADEEDEEVEEIVKTKPIKMSVKKKAKKADEDDDEFER
ncbi:hypothetical protein G6011_06179 [Alternaria panax]|uniref:Uncharacterized protein n=1 Tax=Alternaria panax TaxID=48097 RepID=A0AAD4I9A0_9PLEO|nr:hypothetical protein G6011_06179 [Alternaria panax]